jgi:hypothetical protein
MKRTLQSFLMLMFSVSFWGLQAQVIEGTIYDKQGLPLPGASVVVVGQQGVGTSADFDGNYTISGITPGTIVLEFSFIGFEAKKIEVELKKGSNVVAAKANKTDRLPHNAPAREQVVGETVGLL